MRFIIMLSMILLSASVSATSSTHIKGRVVDESGHPLKDVSIVVNGIEIRSGIDGQYLLNAKKARTYQLVLNKEGYFSSVQTFSSYELDQSASESIADIILVKQVEGRIMLAFGGDVMMGRRYYEPYFGDEILIHEGNKLKDSQAIVKHIKPYMSIADFASVNLETQIAETKPKQRAQKSVTFFSRPEILKALSWAGIDYVSLGNNHTYDYLDSGLESTLSYLEQSELGYSGAGENEKLALAAYNKNKKLLTIAQFINNSSATTASILGLKDRGQISLGYKADIIVIDPERYSANASFSEWDRYSSGVEYVWLNGQEVIKESQYQEKLVGQFVR